MRSRCLLLPALVLATLVTLVARAEPPPPSPPGSSSPPATDAGTPAPALTPPRLLADSPALYPDELRASAVQGVVRLELVIDEQGEVDRATLLEEVHPLLDASALHAATRLKFTPALLGDRPVPARLEFSYRFEAAPPVLPPGPPTGTLKGLVRARGNRRPIPGAVLSIGDGDDHFEADPSGRFSVPVPAGRQRVHVSAPGYRARDYMEDLQAGGSLEVIYALEPLVVNPYETIVRADKERTEVSRITLHEQEIREVPGTMGDPFRVVMLLPGVSSILSGVAYPVVRGAQPAATGYYIDGIRVPILFHLLLGPAVVHPDFLETMDFYPGGAPPEYGRLTGGVINGRISRPREDRLHSTAYADLINAGLFAEYPFEKTGTSVTLAGRVSYTPWLIALAGNILSPDPGQKMVLDFGDYQGRLEQKLGGGSLRLFAFGSSDRTGTEATAAGQGGTALVGVGFHRVDLRYRRPLGPGEAEVGLTWGLDQLGVDTKERRYGPGGADATTSNFFNLGQWSLRARAGWSATLLPQLKLVAGADVDRRESVLSLKITQPSTQPGTPGITLDLNTPTAVGTLASAYVQATWTPGPRWRVVPGLRVDSYHLVPGIDHLAFEPRLAARYELTPTVTLKGGAGLYHQPPTFLISLPVADIAGLEFGLQQAIQMELGVEWRPLSGLEIGVDAYFNPLPRTLEASPFDSPAQGGGGPPSDPPSDPGDSLSDVLFASLGRNTSRGRATGLELLVRHPLGGNWFGWLAYSLQYSARYRQFQRYDELGQVIGTGSGYVPFAFDQTHVLNAVVSYKLPGNWTLGATLHFNSGFPESGGITSTTMRQGTDPSTGLPAWVPVDLDKVDRLPPFLRLDLRVAKSWVHDTFSMELYFDFMNALLSQEVQRFSYDGGGGGPLLKVASGVLIPLPILGLKGTY